MHNSVGFNDAIDGFRANQTPQNVLQNIWQSYDRAVKIWAYKSSFCCSYMSE